MLVKYCIVYLKFSSFIPFTNLPNVIEILYFDRAGEKYLLTNWGKLKQTSVIYLDTWIMFNCLILLPNVYPYPRCALRPKYYSVISITEVSIFFLEQILRFIFVIFYFFIFEQKFLWYFSINKKDDVSYLEELWGRKFW